MKNITLSIDDDLLEKGRKYASAHNTSFNSMVRELVKRAVQNETTNWVGECFRKMDQAEGHSAGKSWTRESLYDV